MKKKKSMEQLITYVIAAALSVSGLAFASPAFAQQQSTAADETVSVNVLKDLLPQSHYGRPMELPGGESVGQKVSILYADAATDGDTSNENTDGSGYFTIVSSGEASAPDQIPADNVAAYLQYDMGKAYDITKINIYRDKYSYMNNLAASNGVYKDVKVMLANKEDFSDAVYVYGTAERGEDYTEDWNALGAPQMILLESPISARYIKISGRGIVRDNRKGWSHYYGENRFAEIQVMADVPKSEAGNSEENLVNIASATDAYAFGKGLENPQYLSDGKKDSNYSVNQSTGSGAWINFDYKQKYRIRQVHVNLEPGSYNHIKIQIGNSPSMSGAVTIFEQNNFNTSKAAEGKIDGVASWVCKGDGAFAITLDDQYGERVSHVRFTIDRGAKQVKLSEVELLANLTKGTTIEMVKEAEAFYYNPDADFIPAYSQFDQLVWSDEFHGTEVDTSKWNIIDGMVNHGAIYNKGAVNIGEEEGNDCLVINTKNYGTTEELIKKVGVDQYDDTIPGHVTWSSGRVESKNKYSFQYGRLAARVKVNDSKGIWPAVWMLSQDEVGHDEIDVLEYLGNSGDVFSAWTTNHYGKYGYTKGSDGKVTSNYEAWSKKFHVFEVEWTPEVIEFYIDGKKVHTTTAGKNTVDGMHTRAMFAILETQVGAGWVGDVDYSRNLTKQDSNYYIDWIRVYQKADSRIVSFDDLAGFEDTDQEVYTITPYKISGKDDFIALTTTDNGEKEPQYLNKNNFGYGGQPRYETSRLAAADNGSEEKYLIYQIKDLRDIHLTAYYQTVEGLRGENPPQTPWEATGVGIFDRMASQADIYFKLYVSGTGEEGSWTLLDETNCKKYQNFKNFIDPYPNYARLNLDAYGIPEGTSYVKVVFPEISGKRYLNKDGTETALKNTDIQLAKMTFVQ